MSETFLLVRRLLSALRLKYKERREVYRREKESQGYKVVFVHELTQCSSRENMAKLFPELEMFHEMRPRFILGELIHMAIQNIFGSEDKVYEKEILVDG